jgi:hypothetical protein
VKAGALGTYRRNPGKSLRFVVQKLAASRLHTARRAR